MDFLTFVDKIFSREWNLSTNYTLTPNISFLRSCFVIIRIPENQFCIEVEKLSSRKFRLDVPFKMEDGDDFCTLDGDYEYFKSVLDDLLSMGDTMFKLSYGTEKPDITPIKIDFKEIYENLLIKGILK